MPLADDRGVLRTLAIAGYRSLRDLRLELGDLTVVTGPNGAGKSNFYRALRLLQETALGGAIGSLAREGGLSSVLWAGPEAPGRAVRRGEHPVQGTVRKEAVSLRVGFADDDFSYSIEFGVPVASSSAFAQRGEPECEDRVERRAKQVVANPCQRADREQRWWFDGRFFGVDDRFQ